MPSMNNQASSDKTYNDAITLLVDAQKEITGIKGGIETEQHVLGGVYGGDDGSAYGVQLVKWLGIMQDIINTCRVMQDKLADNQQAANIAQQSNMHLIADAGRATGGGDTSLSGHTYSALTS